MTMKNKTARKILLFVMSLGVFMTIGLPHIYAAAMTQNSTALSNPSSGASTDTMTFTFYPGSTNTIKEINIQLSATAPATGNEGSITGTTAVASPGITVAAMTVNGSDVHASWAPITTSSQGLITLQNSSGTSMTPTTPVVISINNITNPTIGNCTASGGSSTDTCYANVTDATAFGGAVVDTGSSTFTVTADTTASATINPSLTFTVGGITNGTSYASNLTTTTASTYNSLPFGGGSLPRGDALAGMGNYLSRESQGDLHHWFLSSGNRRSDRGRRHSNSGN